MKTETKKNKAEKWCWVFWKILLLPSIACIVLPACGYTYDQRDRVISMKPYEHVEIEVPGGLRKISPEQFLTLYSGMIIHVGDHVEPSSASIDSLSCVR